MSSNLSIADQIAMTGHALTAKELANILAISHVTIFKQAKAGRIPSFASEPAYVLTRRHRRLAQEAVEQVQSQDCTFWRGFECNGDFSPIIRCTNATTATSR